MKSDITKFIAIRNSLLQERSQIEARLAQINRALGASAPAAPAAVASAAVPTGKRTFSAATKAKMRASQAARWAKIKGAAPAPAAAAAPKKARRKLSAAGRAAIVAAAKARWAKVNAAKAKAGK